MADIGRILFVVNLVIAGLISVMGPILAVERFQQNYSVWFAVMYSMFQAGMLLGNLAVFFKWNTKRLNRLYPRTLTAADCSFWCCFSASRV